MTASVDGPHARHEAGPARDSSGKEVVALYLLTTFLSAFLLFAVQPLIAKYILPWFGGTPSVWTTCMLFFQVLLLGGYAHAHLLSTRLGPRGQTVAQVTVLLASLALLMVLGRVWDAPITPGAGWKPGSADDPVAFIVVLLAVSVGLPFFVLSTTGPLLQAWFARMHPGVSPYRLYAVSNVGSLLALLSYPFIVEPRLSLRVQAQVWSWAYGGFALAGAACAAASWGRTPRVEVGPAASPTPSEQLLWLGLAACPSIMLLATTNQLCQDVGVVPFLWILPLGLYLLSFVVCFENPRWYSRRWWHPAFGVALVAGCVVVTLGPILHLPVQIGAHSFVLLAICMVCHGELVRMRPGPGQLTSFYLLVAAGGALGGGFVAVVAPVLFKGFWEYHLALGGSALLVFALLIRDRRSWLHEANPWMPGLLMLGAALFPELAAAGAGKETFAARWPYHLLVVLASVPLVRSLSRRSDSGSARWLQVCCAGTLVLLAEALVVNAYVQLRSVVALSRNFYGVLAVVPSDSEDPEWRAYVLRHGSVMHGFQFRDPAKQLLPTAYYAPSSGLGLAILNHPRRQSGATPMRIGGVGLGIGTIAAYGRPGDYVRFYEINPEVLRLAHETEYFSYLRTSAARVEVILGDARLSMERELEQGGSQQFDVLVLDAFSGGAIPLHLLTEEAFRIYLEHLRNPGGILALHISNEHIDLRPVVFALADHFGLATAYIHTHPDAHVTSESDWVLAARDRTVLDLPEVAGASTPRDQHLALGQLWTDDYSNLFRILRN